MPDGRHPASGGWNRIRTEVNDLAEAVENLKPEGGRFRSTIVVGNGGKKILLDDLPGNPIKLFWPAR
jgi:hypothetical protein